MDKATLQKQVNTYQARIKDLDINVLCLKELIELFKAEAVIAETKLEHAYEDLHEATSARAIEESRFQRCNDELGLLLCKEGNKLPEPTGFIAGLLESCTCTTYEWSGHTCPYAEDVYDDHDTVCHCCPFCQQQCYEDT